MQQATDPTGVLEQDAPSTLSLRRPRRLSARTSAAIGFSLAVVLLAVVPPLVSLNRYQRRVTTNMARVLGRPVHLDHVALNLLPLPSFTLENLVIDEAPEFGAEPLIRANTVTARLRFSSLWRRRVEFSRITFIDPSVNLVHLPDGRWNLEGVLRQASYTETAPTAQTGTSAAPRFPYIEATGARINLKLGVEKTPFSLTEADFALWLPVPRQWKMRIAAKPVRTDTNIADTGTLQIEASIERASALGELPLTVDADWNDAPLGGVGRLLSGNDPGLRGRMSLSAHLRGVLSSARLQLRAQIDGVHRTDVIPAHALSVDLECSASSTHLLRSIEDLRCIWPIPDSEGATLAMTGAVPDLLHPRSAQVQIGTPGLPAEVLTTWAHGLSARIPDDLQAAGSLAATLQYNGAPGAWQGHAALDDLTLSGGPLGKTLLPVGTINLQTAPQTGAGPSHLQLAPVGLPLGGHDPAILDGSADAHGYSLHLAGMIALPRLLAVAATVPQLGEGLALALPKNRAAGPTRLDLTAYRLWTGPQVWTDTQSRQSAAPLPHRSPAASIRRRHRR